MGGQRPEGKRRPDQHSTAQEPTNRLGFGLFVPLNPAHTERSISHLASFHTNAIRDLERSCYNVPDVLERGDAH